MLNKSTMPGNHNKEDTMTSTKRFLVQFFFSLSLLAAYTAGGSFAAAYTVTSPDGSIVATINETPTFQFTVTKSGKTAIPLSPLGLTTNNMNLATGISFVSQTTAIINETYPVYSGTRSVNTNHCNELTLNLKNAANNQFALVVRAYDEGVAFRYVIQGTGNTTVNSEATAFIIPAGTVTWRGVWRSDYQPNWTTFTGTTNGAYEVPVLGRTPDSLYILMSEAGAVIGTYCAAHFQVTGNNYVFAYQASPTSALPLATPWRYVMVGTLKNVFENTLQMAENLNPPCAIADPSWIKPGRSSWSWCVEGVSNFAQQKRYMDFEKQMNWEYCLLDAGWPQADSGQIHTYARSQGVKLIWWYSWSDLRNQSQWTDIINKAVATGCVNALKLDYIGSDAQDVMQWEDDICKATAAAKLLVYFHGNTLPRGKERTYPNFITNEGVAGEEGYPGIPIDHMNILPYTRNAEAAMDYTPGMLTGRSHNTTYACEMAICMIYFSGIQHYTDKPENYNAFRPNVIPYLQALPASWDESRFLAGDPANYCCVARRKGQNWFVAGMANASRQVTLDMSFLRPGSYAVNMFSDSLASGSKQMIQRSITVSSPGSITVMMASAGGFFCEIPNSITGTIDSRKTDGLIKSENRGVSIVQMGDHYRIRSTGFIGTQCALVNPRGQVVMSLEGSATGEYSIQSRGLALGLYMVRVSSGSYSITKPFVHK
jgi:hypothetical protein